MTKPVYIYILSDPNSGAVRYVGLTRYPAKRLCNHCHKAATLHFRNWITSLKRMATRPAMEVVASTNEDNASNLESQWILAYRISGADLLNYTTGGEGGYRMSAETIAKLTEKRRSRKCKPLSDEHKKNLSLSQKGRVFPPETVAKAVAASVASRKGKLLTEEHKKKVSIAVRASWTPKMREAASARMKGSKSGNVRVVNSTS